MSLPTSPIPALIVEGETDCHAIIHLLKRNGIELHPNLGPVRINPVGNDIEVLKAMTVAKASTLRPVGFVIDADLPVAQRWQSVCGRLAGLALDLPPHPPHEGFMGRSPITKADIGVWIMPDNKTDLGALEHLVQTLVPAGDALFPHARESTGTAVELGATFPGQSRLKAELHTWLAWQEEPGGSFGTAIRDHYFSHDSPEALAFVGWFRRLYASYL